MKRSALVLAMALVACFALTDAEAAKKKKAEPAKPPADAAYEWNVKNISPMAAPAPVAAPTSTAAPGAAKPTKVAKGSKKKGKKA